MKYFKLNLLTIATLICLCSCIPSYEKGSGALVSETINVNHFDKIDLKGTGTIYYVQGDSHSLKIITDDNIFPLLKPEVRGGELILDIDRVLINPTKLDYYISSPEIRQFNVSGNGTVICEKIITSDKMKIWVSGAGDVNMDLTAKSLDIKISGSGEINTSGLVEDLELKLSGAGNLEAYNLTADHAKINISGAGNATVHVTKSLHAKVSGSGNIKYKGSPKVKSSISGAGSVNSIN
ncbi:MAG: DUF2807 domain-containing protein [Bacteroidetes bacterium]|nr:DUF2807 domain-containing protein [Bacteroidota bacterium]